MDKKKIAISRKIHSTNHPIRDPSEVEDFLKEVANCWIKDQEYSGSLRNRPDWQEAFMLSAYNAADRSSCRYIYTGAVIVKDKRVIASGYNGAPTGIENCRDVGCRKELLGIDQPNRRTGNCRGAHAERNAMDQIARKDLEGSVLYTVVFPCSDCAKPIVGNKISKVYYSIMYGEPDSLTKELFDEAKIELEHLVPDLEKHYLRLKMIDNQRNDRRLSGLG